MLCPLPSLPLFHSFGDSVSFFLLPIHFLLHNKTGSCICWLLFVAVRLYGYVVHMQRTLARWILVYDESRRCRWELHVNAIPDFSVNIRRSTVHHQQTYIAYSF